MRNLVSIFFLFVGLLPVGELRAHIVDWWGNFNGYSSGNPMDFYYPDEFYDFFYVDPSYGELCTVQVNLNSSSSTLVSAHVFPPNPANSVAILVQILRAPSNHLETATITGEWHATGFPPGYNCDATNANNFSVPITVIDPTPLWQIHGTMSGWINLDTGYNAALKFAPSLTGPWLVIGQGQMFTLNNDMPTGFFQRTKQLGGFIAGYVYDNSGAAMPNITLGLPYGGPTATTDSYGTYSLSRMPLGTDLISLTNPIGASLNIEIPNSNTNNAGTNSYVVAMIKAAMVAAPLAAPTNICNCTPWCAIGFATLSGGQTPVYYAGGANSPNGGTPSCGQPQVTVTPPGGVPFSITPGTSQHQNSGPNPAAGTWSVTAIVCGKTKSATVTVP